MWRKAIRFLFNVAPTDPIALAGALSLLLLTAFAAAYIPARRATQLLAYLAYPSARIGDQHVAFCVDSNTDRRHQLSCRCPTAIAKQGPPTSYGINVADDHRLPIELAT